MTLFNVFFIVYYCVLVAYTLVRVKIACQVKSVSISQQ